MITPKNQLPSPLMAKIHRNSKLSSQQLRL
jgi:hypothetical protein